MSVFTPELQLPMEDAVENALIVNAIQRASNIIVQCSSREAFGLTATEAMYKRVAFIGTQAVGLRVQVRHQQDGILVQGDCTDAKNVARAINVLLGCDQYRHSVAVNGQKRAVDEFLIHRQMMDWIRCALLVCCQTTRFIAVVEVLCGFVAVARDCTTLILSTGTYYLWPLSFTAHGRGAPYGSTRLLRAGSRARERSGGILHGGGGCRRHVSSACRRFRGPHGGDSSASGRNNTARGIKTPCGGIPSGYEYFC